MYNVRIYVDWWDIPQSSSAMPPAPPGPSRARHRWPQPARNHSSVEPRDPPHATPGRGIHGNSGGFSYDTSKAPTVHEQDGYRTWHVGCSIIYIYIYILYTCVNSKHMFFCHCSWPEGTIIPYFRFYIASHFTPKFPKITCSVGCFFLGNSTKMPSWPSWPVCSWANPQCVQLWGISMLAFPDEGWRTAIPSQWSSACRVIRSDLRCKRR